jgi:hypothetical protein
MGPNGEDIRQLTFEQDHDYSPCVLNNGRSFTSAGTIPTPCISGIASSCQ